MSSVLTALAVAIIFYLLLPLSGAFTVRHKWRLFRKRIIEASLRNEVSYANPDRGRNGPAGSFSFTGELQAIQDNSTIWLSNGRVSVKAEVHGVRLYLLPTSRSMEQEGRLEENKEFIAQDMPKRLSWERVYSLTQGSGVLLSGHVEVENGTPVFRNTESEPLLVIIYDGKKETILRRSIWAGRQLNEYWNSLTPLSLITGSFFLFVLAFIAFRQPRVDNTAVFTAVLSFIPSFPFVPPGLFLYFIFRKLWRSGRSLRGERDLLRLVLRNHNYEEFKSCAAAMDAYKDAGIRNCSLIDNSVLMNLPCRVYAEQGCRDSGPPEHFFEKLIIPGDPEELARQCVSRARKMEFLAAASISSGFIINGLLIYFILLWFI